MASQGAQSSTDSTHLSRLGSYTLGGPDDARKRYKGFSFVFATDSYHDEDRIFGRDTANSVSYIKPLIHGETYDSLPPLKLPYFFTGFTWTDGDQHSRTTSRVEICHAWQVAFNLLLYYGSLTGEMGQYLSEEENTWVRRQFSLWDDLFTEVDEALGRITECERLRLVPIFAPPKPISDLADPRKRTSVETALKSLDSTFLAAAVECKTRSDGLRVAPLQEAMSIERKLRPWEPCRGHPIVSTNEWSIARLTGGIEGHGSAEGRRRYMPTSHHQPS